MQGHIARKRDRYYAVIYEGLDPVTGKERRTSPAHHRARANTGPQRTLRMRRPSPTTPTARHVSYRGSRHCIAWL